MTRADTAPRVRVGTATDGRCSRHALYAWGPGICDGVPRPDGTLARPSLRRRRNGTNPVVLHAVYGDRRPPAWMRLLADELDGTCTLAEARTRVALAVRQGPASIAQTARQARDRAARHGPPPR